MGDENAAAFSASDKGLSVSFGIAATTLAASIAWWF